MAQSFTLRQPPRPAGNPSGRLSVLVTGATGNIGLPFARHGHEKYDLKLMVRQTSDKDAVAELKGLGQVIIADVADLELLKQVFQSVHTAVHLAGDPSPNATWDSLLPSNIVGTYNVLAAAKAAGCQRVIHASSIHAVSGGGPGQQSHTSEPSNPGDLYGVSKCFGEALGRYMAEQEGLSIISLRIGAYQPEEAIRNKDSISLADSWISPRDMNQLFDLCIAADHIQWAVFNALSNNAFNRLDISDAKELLGYKPVDNAFEVIPGLGDFDFAAKLMKHSLEDSFAKSGTRNETA